jgi:hypothetical protein
LTERVHTCVLSDELIVALILQVARLQLAARPREAYMHVTLALWLTRVLAPRVGASVQVSELIKFRAHACCNAGVMRALAQSLDDALAGADAALKAPKADAAALDGCRRAVVEV